MMKRPKFPVWLAFILLPTFLTAAVPQNINYQGLQTDAGGNPVADGVHSVAFMVYVAAVGGSSGWMEPQNVTTVNGLSAVTLDSLNPIVDTVFNEPLAI